jgi:hypothetical protein
MWANYGVLDQKQYPFAISTSDDCLATNVMSVMENECNGKTECSSVPGSGDLRDRFLPSTSTCTQSKILLVRYKCKSNVPGMNNTKCLRGLESTLIFMPL